jgi:hypothetical protein
MQKYPFFIFIALLLIIGGGYAYLEYGKRGSKPKKKDNTSTTTDILANTSPHGQTKSFRLRTTSGAEFQFELPALWEPSIEPFSPSGPSPVNSGYKITLQNREDSIEINYFSPIKFQFYLGELGTYLKNQRHPLLPVEILEEFFGHDPTNCKPISAPFKNWNGVKSPTAEYYSDVNINWYKIKKTEKPTYYYIKVEKNPTPGVYGDLGSWTFSGFQFNFANDQILSKKKLQAAHIFYQSLKKGRSTADSDNKS